MKNSNIPPDMQVKEWLIRAGDDELNARSILKHKDGTPSGVCFLTQQMAEKYLKAFLVYSTMDYPKIHQLDKLLELCAAEDDSFNEMRDDAILLNEFYMEMRYPANIPNFSWKEAEEAFKTAEKIRDFVLGKLKNIEK